MTDTGSADWRDIPSLSDPFAARLSKLWGGPLGSHALVGRSRFWTPTRVLLLLGVVFLALGWFSKAACLQQDNEGGLDWSAHRPYIAMCYSDVLPLYGAERLDRGEFPYKSWWVEDAADGNPQVRHMEYPVLSGLYQYAAMVVAKAWQYVDFLPQALDPVIYFNIAALGLAFAWLVTVWATALLAGHRVWDAALVAGSPLLVFHAFTNFDALATAFAMSGLLAWARRRPVLAGVLLGLGGAVKLYPLFLLLPILLLCLRAGTLRTGFNSVAAAVAAYIAVNLPIAILYPAGWWEFFRMSSVRHEDPDSLYNVWSSMTGIPGLGSLVGPVDVPVLLNVVSAALFAAVCVGVGWLALTAQQRPRLAQLSFLLIAGFLLTSKVWSPQFSLWLVPLAVLALPDRRLLLAWMTMDALVWVPRMYFYLGSENMGLHEQWFTGTVLVRDVFVVVICVAIVRQIRKPAEDLVRVGWSDDPGGGAFADVPDRVAKESQ